MSCVQPSSGGRTPAPGLALYLGKRRRPSPATRPATATVGTQPGSEPVGDGGGQRGDGRGREPACCPRPSGCAGTCAAALGETPSEPRELVETQLLRLGSWQLYVVYFSPWKG